MHMAINIEGLEVKNMKKYSFGNALFDIIMIFLTGGLWLIWILVKYLRTH